MLRIREHQVEPSLVMRSQSERTGKGSGFAPRGFWDTPALLIPKAALISVPTAMMTNSLYPHPVCPHPILEGWGSQEAWTLTQIWKRAQKGRVVICLGTYGGRSSTSHLLREVPLTIHLDALLGTQSFLYPGSQFNTHPDS